MLALLQECDGGVKVISSFTDCYCKPYPTITLDFDKAYVDRYTGIDISTETIVKTLTGLGFGLKLSGDKFSVTVPSWRATKDVTIKADIIEEISRIYGYDNFLVCTSVSPIRSVRAEAQKTFEDRMKDILVKSYRMHEVHSYIWSDTAENAELSIKTPENVRIINAQTPDHQYIRVSMIPTLLGFIKNNKSYSDSFGIFEIGHTVEGLRADGYCDERCKLGVALFSKSEGEEALFMQLTAVAKELCRDILHKSPSFKEAEAKLGFEHPKNCFAISVDGCEVGFISVAHPTVSMALDKKGAVAFLEIDTEKFSKVGSAKLSYKLPSKYPAIEIDMTFSCDIESLDFGKVRAAAMAAAPELLSDVAVMYTYEQEGACALTLRFYFLSYERTLTKQELAPVTDCVAEALLPLGLSIKE